ncbi:MAG: hypothetical protein GX275_01725 [Clostridiales bacterium]|nr:hypothetical protein [Clostridiales bacterium]
MIAIDVLINSINAQIEELNKANFKLYDSNDVDWYLKNIEYNPLEDRLYFNTKEDRNGQA